MTEFIIRFFAYGIFFIVGVIAYEALIIGVKRFIGEKYETPVRVITCLIAIAYMAATGVE